MVTSRAVVGVVGVRGRGLPRTHTRGQSGLSGDVAPRLRAQEVGRVTNRRYSGLLRFLTHRQPASERVAPAGTGFNPARPGCTRSPLLDKAWLLAATILAGQRYSLRRTFYGGRRPSGSLVGGSHPEVAAPSLGQEELEHVVDRDDADHLVVVVDHRRR